MTDYDATAHISYVQQPALISYIAVTDWQYREEVKRAAYAGMSQHS